MNIHLVCLAFSLSVVYAEEHSRGCVYIMGTCHRECEPGTHSYNTGCGYLHPEPTCDNPSPQVNMRGKICDFSACYCDPPTVREITTNSCVKLEDCPKSKE